MQHDLFLVFSTFMATHLNGHALMGAVFGCCFFLGMPLDRGCLLERLLLTVFSAGLGYASASTPLGQESPMLVAAIVSALAVAVMIPVYDIVKDKDLVLDLLKHLTNFWRR